MFAAAAIHKMIKPLTLASQKPRKASVLVSDLLVFVYIMQTCAQTSDFIKHEVNPPALITSWYIKMRSDLY